MLVIYELCDAGQGSNDDFASRTELRESAPSTDDLVWMNPDTTEKCWSVVATHLYKPTEPTEQVDSVCLALVSRSGEPTPLRENWDCQRDRDISPNEVIHLLMTGSEVYAQENVMSGEPPTVGSVVMDYERTGVMTPYDSELSREVPTDLTISSYHTYLPTADAPYPSIYIAHCVAKVPVAA